MVGVRSRLPRSRRVRRRLGVSAVALVVALPLLMQPELWQYLTAAILVHDFILGLRGVESEAPENHGRETLAEGEERHEGLDRAAESDAVRTAGNQP
jgi:hypothetical protein